MPVLKKKQNHSCLVNFKMSHAESYVVNLAPTLSGPHTKINLTK